MTIAPSASRKAEKRVNLDRTIVGKFRVRDSEILKIRVDPLLKYIKDNGFEV